MANAKVHQFKRSTTNSVLLVKTEPKVRERRNSTGQSRYLKISSMTNKAKITDSVASVSFSRTLEDILDYVPRIRISSALELRVTQEEPGTPRRRSFETRDRSRDEGDFDSIIFSKKEEDSDSTSSVCSSIDDLKKPSLETLRMAKKRPMMSQRRNPPPLLRSVSENNMKTRILKARMTELSLDLNGATEEGYREKPYS